MTGRAPAHRRAIAGSIPNGNTLPHTASSLGSRPTRPACGSTSTPRAMPGVVLAKTDPQRLIREAKPGAVVTIPPGLYGQGLFIDKSLTVRLKDVRLWGVAKGKGTINVKCDGCTVVIEASRLRALTSA